MTSEAKKRADMKCHKKIYVQVPIVMRKDADLTLAMVKEYAASRGESFGGFVRRAIAETMARDTENEQDEGLELVQWKR